jgi:vitamin B12 transporter
MQRTFLFSIISVGATFIALSIGSVPNAGADDKPPAPPTTPSKPAGAAPNHSQSKSTGASAPTAKTSTQAPKTPEQKTKLPRMVIVVTASRMPQPLGEVGDTTSVVSSHQIAVQQIPNVTDALREVPGVDVTQSGSPGTIADVSIRGSSASQTLILIDGVPVNDSATDSFDISRLLTDGLDRIEVVRGAGGALYGSQAIGGVINLIAREGSGPPKFTLLSMGGNRASQRQVLTLEGARGKLAYSGSLSYFQPPASVRSTTIPIISPARCGSIIISTKTPRSTASRAIPAPTSASRASRSSAAFR